MTRIINKVMLSLMIYYGQRLAEKINIKLSDMSLGRGRLRLSLPRKVIKPLWGTLGHSDISTTIYKLLPISMQRLV